MLGIVINIPPAITDYFNSTPADIIGGQLLLYVLGPFVLFCVLVWGMLQVWIDLKQGQYWSKLEWDLLAVTIPQDAINTPMGMENFFNNLAGSKSSITKKEEWINGKFQAYFTFEIISNGGNIQFYIRTIKKYRDLVEAAFYAQYPEAQIVEVDDYVDVLPNDFPNDEYDLFGSEISMSKEGNFPLKTYEAFEHQGEKDLRFKDPILPMIEIMGKMKPGEYYWIQLLIISPDSQDWRKEGLKFIAKTYGKEEPKKKSMIDDSIGWIPKEVMSQVTGAMFGEGGDEKAADDFRMFKITPDERDLLDAVKDKCAKIGWYSKIRVVYCAKHELYRKGTVAAMTKGIFNQFDSGFNKLGLTDTSTPKDDYFWQEWQMASKQKTLMSKYKNHSFSAGVTPYILSSAELATIFHFPAADARTPALTSLGSRMSEAPGELQYAPEGSEILLNFDKAASDVLAAAPDAAKKYAHVPPMSVPRPTAPTSPFEYREIQKQGSNIIEEGMPQAGMPAPLPPGLDLADEPIDEMDGPSNLPM